ncbi:DinB family protein [Amycolatopsis sp. H20-H5]|uniref:DinB family protein n=1 Tax=Amycolatopsis sp. H20-H5 TaxID=3046309 RepID=UPI002DBDC039|nr:DinB family protein [Amycolatopsis sp. H20-H5]MEC3978485.1 DinB family protein [Amycolatopsis sp. H20-H5]
MTTNQPLPGERGDVLQTLVEQRHMLRITVRGIGDEEASKRTTVSELTLGGLIKHITRCERAWLRLLLDGDGEVPEEMMDMNQYTMTAGETLAGLLDEYAAAAAFTDETLAGLPDLDRTVPLPIMPWSPPERQYWSARRILLHIIRETAQHSGHADMIREALDGANSTAQLGVDSANGAFG